MNPKSSRIFLKFQKNTFTKFLSRSLKNQLIKLGICCLLLGLAILIITFLMHFSQQNRVRLEIDAQRTVLVHKVMSAVEERFSFLSNTALNKQKISRVLGNIPPFPLQLLTDAFIIRDTEKYTKHGQVSLLELDKQYQREGVFIDSFDNLCFVRKNLNDFYVIRVSIRSLSPILMLRKTYSLSFVGNDPREKSIRVAKAGWLVIEEEQPHILRTFVEEYVWLVIILPILMILIVGSYFLLYVYIFFITHRKYHEQIKVVEGRLNELKNRKNILNIENQKMLKISTALKRKQKIQGELYQELVNYRRELAEKISDISRLVSRSFIDSDKLLDDREIAKLLSEVSKTAQTLSDYLFDMNTSEQLSFKQCVEQVDKYLGWNLLKTGVSLSYNIKDVCFLESNELGLKLLLINILLHHIEHAYEGAEVILHVSQTADKINIFISCKNSLETSTILGTEDLSNPLILPPNALSKLAAKLGFSYLAPDAHTTQLTYPLTKPEIEIRGANVVSIFR